MAEKAKKNNKNLIIGICTGVLIIAIIIVAVIFATKSSLNDSYFVSDGSKYVLTVDRDMLETEDKENSPSLLLFRRRYHWRNYLYGIW